MKVYEEMDYRGEKFRVFEVYDNRGIRFATIRYYVKEDRLTMRTFIATSLRTKAKDMVRNILANEAIEKELLE